MPFVACRLIPLDKNPGMSSIGRVMYLTGLWQRLPCLQLVKIYFLLLAHFRLVQTIVLKLRLLSMQWRNCLIIMNVKQFSWLMPSAALIITLHCITFQHLSILFISSSGLVIYRWKKRDLFFKGTTQGDPLQWQCMPWQLFPWLDVSEAMSWMLLSLVCGWCYCSQITVNAF